MLALMPFPAKAHFEGTSQTDSTAFNMRTFDGNQPVSSIERQ